MRFRRAGGVYRFGACDRDLKLDECGSLPWVTRIKGNLEGVVLRIYDENGERKEESHTVKGEFEYNLPK